MIKLQDFARACKVTDRAIQKHIKKHAAELDGHVHRNGPNGTWLDEFAQDFIRARMIRPQIVVSDGKDAQDLQELQEKVAMLQEKLIAAQELALASQGALVEAQAARLALDAAEKEREILEGFIKDAKENLEIKTQELTESRQETRKAQDEAKDLRERLAASEARERALDAELNQVSGLSWLKKLRWKRQG